MSLIQLAAPNLDDLALGGATLYLLESEGFTSDGKLMLVKATYLDGGDTSNSLHYAYFVYDTEANSYLYSLNAAIGGSSARDIDILSAQISGSVSDYTVAAQHSVKGQNTSTLALLENGVVSSTDPVLAITGISLDGLGDNQIEHFLLSSDGRFIAIQTTSGQFGEGLEVDTNNEPDIYLFDTQTEQVTRVSYIGGSGVSNPTYLKDMYLSEGQLHIAFVTDAPFTSLSVDANTSDVGGEAGVKSDLYLWQAAIDETGVTGVASFSLMSETFESVASGYVDRLDTVKITDLGVYFNASTDLMVDGDSNNAKDVFVYSFTSNSVSRLALGDNAELSSGASLVGASNNGRFVSLLSDATEVAGTTGAQQLFYLDTQTGEYQLTSSSTAGAFADNTTVDGSVAANGSIVAFTSLATNLTSSSPPAPLGSVYLQQYNSPPTGSVTISGDLLDGSVLTASDTLADTDGLGNFNYQWYRDGVAIDGATAKTYTTTLSDVNASLSVTVSYLDGQGLAESVSSSPTDPIVYINYDPTGTVLVTGNTTQGQVLSIFQTLDDADGLGTFVYQWLRNDTAIQGATKATYSLTQADVDATLKVTISYVDGDGETESVTSAASPIVANINDTPEGVVLISGITKVGEVLTAKDSIMDADGLGAFNYQWYRDDTAIDTATSSTYTLQSADLGSQMSVTISYLDGYDTNESVSSSSTDAVTQDIIVTSLDGLIYHWSSHMLLADVAITAKDASGSTLATQTTGSDGAFSLSSSVDLSGVEALREVQTADTNRVITSADALAALKIAVGLNPNTDPDGDGPETAADTSPYQYIAADINGDGRVTSADALAILKMAVRLPDAPVAEWLFVQESELFWDDTTSKYSTTRTSVSYDSDGLEITGASDQNVNFVAVLKGDVNGSWSAGDATQTLPLSYFQGLVALEIGPEQQWYV